MTMTPFIYNIGLLYVSYIITSNIRSYWHHHHCKHKSFWYVAAILLERSNIMPCMAKIGLKKEWKWRGKFLCFTIFWQSYPQTNNCVARNQEMKQNEKLMSQWHTNFASLFIFFKKERFSCSSCHLPQILVFFDERGCGKQWHWCSRNKVPTTKLDIAAALACYTSLFL